METVKTWKAHNYLMTILFLFLIAKNDVIQLFLIFFCDIINVCPFWQSVSVLLEKYVCLERFEYGFRELINTWKIINESLLETLNFRFCLVCSVLTVSSSPDWPGLEWVLGSQGWTWTSDPPATTSWRSRLQKCSYLSWKLLFGVREGTQGVMHARQGVYQWPIVPSFPPPPFYPHFLLYSLSLSLSFYKSILCPTQFVKLSSWAC